MIAPLTYSQACEAISVLAEQSYPGDHDDPDPIDVGRWLGAIDAYALITGLDYACAEDRIVTAVFHHRDGW